MKIKADIQTRTAADPLPDSLRKALFMIRADVRTNGGVLDDEGRYPNRREHRPYV